MEELKKYLKDVLGVEIKVTGFKSDKLKTLPLFIVSEYDFELIKLYRQDILLVFVKGDFTIERLKKHLDIIRNTFNTITVAIINKLESYIRLRLIEKQIPFIIPGKQMYLPDLLIDLKEFGIKPRELPQSMQPATQLLLLYHLQIESLEGINLKGIAEKLMYEAMTVSRAVFYLHNTGLATLHGSKEKFLHFENSRKELWENAEPLMNSPVKKVQYYNGWVTNDNMYKTNMNALAHYSDINDDVVEYYAVRPGQMMHIGPVNPKRTGPLEGNICIEEWKYNPYLLTRTEFVDPLSLYLCFRNKPDERIEMALEQIIKNMKW